MASNMSVSAPPLKWPTLRRPAGGEKLVYLDQKHWIHLAQADTGHADGSEYLPALRAARAAKAAGTAVFPLSVTHYNETIKITDPKQRGDIAKLMEELSGFTSLPARRLVALYELDAALLPAAGLGPSVLPQLDLLGHGFRWSHYSQVVGRFVGPDGTDGSELLREAIGQGGLTALQAAVELSLERALLTGPSDQDLPKLQALGYDPAAIVRAAQDRAENEAAFSAMVSDEVRRHPTDLLDRVLVRELNDPAVIPAWKQLALVYGMGVLDGLPDDDPPAARALTRAMPSFEVLAVLKTDRHKDKTRRWTSNDMFDLDALSAAVPYCDLVGADNAQIHSLTVTGLATRMQTTLFSSVTDLPAHL